MSKFTEKFYHAFYKARENLATQKVDWEHIKAVELAGNPLLTARELIQLHFTYEAASDKIIALENLWGIYAQGFADARFPEDVEYNELKSLEELEKFLKGETK